MTDELSVTSSFKLCRSSQSQWVLWISQSRCGLHSDGNLIPIVVGLLLTIITPRLYRKLVQWKLFVNYLLLWSEIFILRKKLYFTSCKNDLFPFSFKLITDLFWLTYFSWSIATVLLTVLLSDIRQRAADKVVSIRVGFGPRSYKPDEPQLH